MLLMESKQRGNDITQPVYENLASTYGFKRTNYEGFSQIARSAYLQNFVTYRCISEIQKASRKVEFKVYKRNKTKAEVVENHPVELLLSEPNKSYFGSELKNRSILFYFLVGEASYQCFKNTFRNHLYVYRPDRVYREATGNPMEPYKNIEYRAGGVTPIPAEEYFVWKNYNPLDQLDGLGFGYSELTPIFKAIDQFNAKDEWNLSQLENGAHVSGMIGIKEVLQDDEYDRATKVIAQAHQGPRNIGKIMLMEGGATFTPTSIKPVDMDFSNLENQLIKRICSAIGPDPILIGYNEFSSFNNKQEASKDLFTKNIIPILTDMADCFNMYFTNIRLLKPGEYIGLDTSKVEELQRDKKETAERLSKKTAMSENEKRAEQGLSELPGLDIVSGDNYIYKDGEVFIPMNMIPTTPELKEGKKEEDFYY